MCTLYMKAKGSALSCSSYAYFRNVRLLRHLKMSVTRKNDVFKCIAELEFKPWKGTFCVPQLLFTYKHCIHLTPLICPPVVLYSVYVATMPPPQDRPKWMILMFQGGPSLVITIRRDMNIEIHCCGRMGFTLVYITEWSEGNDLPRPHLFSGLAYLQLFWKPVAWSKGIWKLNLKSRSTILLWLVPWWKYLLRSTCKWYIPD